MKKVISVVLCLTMLMGLFIGFGSASAEASKGVINLYSFTDEVPKMVTKYLELHPDFGYTVNPTIIATTDGLYQPALDQALAAGGADAPDMYCAESAFVLKYTQGDMASYAAPYADLGIDVAGETKAADI
ncbi:MAG TPA: carbohydrate ABC transporter substrate-binding protein, partial [Candidatus Limiplasma sp.]|nr:carbohydrate ABC transporter substrate-binding protein [Candidatus Limiplasma sp.]